MVLPAYADGQGEAREEREKQGWLRVQAKPWIICRFYGLTHSSRGLWATLRPSLGSLWL